MSHQNSPFNCWQDTYYCHQLPCSKGLHQPLNAFPEHIAAFDLPSENPSTVASYNISFKRVFCAGVRLVGNFTFTVTVKSPLSVGFLLFGMPRPGKVVS